MARRPDQILWEKNNPDRVKEYARKAYLNSKGQGKDRNLKQKFGISFDDYQIMFEQQQGCCATCGRHQDTFTLRLAVDHCHTSGKIRGLLCGPCNTALGSVKENIDTLNSMINYIKENKYAG